MTDKEDRTIYELMFHRAITSGLCAPEAAIRTSEAFLDGKPARRGKHRISSVKRHQAFWHSQFLITLPADTLMAEPLVLALSRYMSQEQVANFELLEYIASMAPDVIHRAVRYSGLVLRQSHCDGRKLNNSPF